MLQNQIGRCLAERIIQAHNKNEDFKIYIVIPSVPGVNGILENNTAQEKFIVGINSTKSFSLKFGL